MINDAWAQTQGHDPKRPHILTFVALGGEGKTSLVANWAAELAARDWVGCEAAFAWSFYSQGTREQPAASSDLFLKEALTFFGDDADKAFAASSASAFEKGQRLAGILGQRCCLLILDGLEPLQYAPAAPIPGQLKDQGIAALLRALAAANHGLCIVNTRYSLPDVKAFWHTTAPEVKLLRLSCDAGAHLLKSLGVTGMAREFTALIEEVKGHALTLTLIGSFLKRAFHGDIRQRDRVKFEKADQKMDGGHAFRTLAAYEQWLLEDGGDEGRRQVAVLRLMGLFDGPADLGCIHALLQPPVIPGLTEPLVGLAEDDWRFCLTGLESARLLTANCHTTGALVTVDAHPHIREYFAKQLREHQSMAWRAAHRRLYEYLCASTPDRPQPTLEDLQPLYQAVAHGCQAGLHKHAFEETFFQRIHRFKEYYAVHKLGAFGTNLCALSCFFDRLWNQPANALPKGLRGSVLSGAGYDLLASGRLWEALGATQAGMEEWIKIEDWTNAAIAAGNLCELELTLGEVARALRDAEHSVTCADRGGDPFIPVATRMGYADALHQVGRRVEAEMLFREAEQMRKDRQPHSTLIEGVAGFRYCDLLLSAAERTAWQAILYLKPESSDLKSLRAASRRAAQSLKWCEQKHYLLDIALDHLTLGRTALYRAIREGSSLNTPHSELDQAVRGLRLAGVQNELPLGLLTIAWCSVAEAMDLRLRGRGPEHQAAQSLTDARQNLDEALEIAERGPMRLFMADIHLYRARLFYREEKYPWESPAADLKASEELINKCSYHRRDEELGDAKRAILGV